MLELYQIDDCHYCVRVRLKLAELGLDYVVRTVPSPEYMRDRVMEISGQPLVPVLVDPERGIVMPESEDIVRYLEEHYGSVKETGR